MRRKGERPIVHPPLSWSEQSTVARVIQTGDRWLYAWVMQQSARNLSRKSGIPQARLDELYHGGDPTEEELAALAGPLRTDVPSLKASIAYDYALRGARDADLPLIDAPVAESLDDAAAGLVPSREGVAAGGPLASAEEAGRA